MLNIDGSQGEGGGQILRSSLALSVATGTPFRMDGIRAKRKKPGLLRQHLAALRAAAAISGAEVGGQALGTSSITFEPGRVRAGDYSFAVGSAGSAMLVLQTVLTPLLLADGPSTVRVEGGTHNPSAPTFDYFRRSFLPQLGRMGASVSAELVRPGFYPAGGGEVRLEIEPVSRPRELVLEERGESLGHRGYASVARLPWRIAEEERKAALQKLHWNPEQIVCEEVQDSAGPGNTLQLELRFENVIEVVTGFGEKGVTARHVGRETASRARRYLNATQPVGHHLADQLLLPMALLAGGRFRALEPTKHTHTNADTLRLFLGDVVSIADEGNGGRRIEVKGAQRL